MPDEQPTAATRPTVPEPLTILQLSDHLKLDHQRVPAAADAYCIEHRLSLRQLHDHDHRHGLVAHQHRAGDPGPVRLQALFPIGTSRRKVRRVR